ncbi:MAG: C40 family peptidase [Bacteroidales bacterium]|jgi:cell wall-associated NlpC family hydrolase|nr:C40 family peptidase [Bacteroidales bacterium]MDD4213462.1 C40 family peptidase [Bacteroidales bacterium]
MRGKIKTEYILNLLFVLLMALIIPNIHSQPGNFYQKNDSIFSLKKDSIPPDTIIKPEYNESIIDSVILFGKQFLGLHYKYGGYTSQGFDCSGYVSYIFKNFGYSFPRSSSGMATVGEKVDIKSARKGDFIYFKGRSTKSSHVGHVALIIEADSGQVTMMHSCHRGVLIEKYNDSDYYKRRYLMCRRYRF